ncbi:MAG: hypothetical protein O7A09_00105 [Proteobacteria bacterium]|nr:hypothetical protein [Pseudomonadota bacterium]
MDSWKNRHRELLESAAVIEASLVELVLAASECSEDESEIADHLDELLASGRVQLQP